MTKLRTTIMASVLLIAPLRGGLCSADLAKSPGGMPPKWLLYEDSLIRFQYPAGWHAEYTPPDQGERSWRVKPSSESILSSGEILIWEFLAGQEKRPLQMIFEEDSGMIDGHVGKPRRKRVEGGRCLFFSAEAKRVFDSDYHEAYAFCYRDSGNFVKIHSTLFHLEGDQRDERKSVAQIFERFRSSLRFKK